MARQKKSASSRCRAIRLAGSFFAMALLVVSALGFGCGFRAGGVYPEASVVLISVDTLRADRLGAYGYRSGRTPHIDAMARDGIVFEDVSSQVPLTLPAHASMLTGLLPPRHEVRDNVGFQLKEGHLTLAERFGAAKFATGGAISTSVLSAQTGIAQGFETWDDTPTIDGASNAFGSLHRDGSVAVESLVKFIQAQGQNRFFAFLHLNEPHAPRLPPEGYRDLKSAYDGDVAYADSLVGRFLEALQAQGLDQRVIVAVTSDHGEGLGDHGEEEHGLLLYREAVQVPLILRLPDGAGRGSRVAGAVAQVDIAPTLLDLAGLTPPATAEMDGVSLRAALRSGRAESRSIYSETLYPRFHFGWSEMYAASEGRFRFILAPHSELFDLVEDPGERRNLASERPTVTASMKAWLTRQKAVVAASTAVAAGPRATLPDPKDKIGAHEALRKAIGLRSAGRDGEAVAALRAVLIDNDSMFDAWQALGLSLITLGRDKEGRDALERAILIDPMNVVPHVALARLDALNGRIESAVAHAEIASIREPGKAFEVLAQIMMDRRRDAEAVRFARRSVEADPRRGMSHFIMGAVARRQGRYEEALSFFEKASAAAAGSRGTVIRSLHFQMGACLAGLGREAEAERAFLAELEVLPRSIEARVGLATLFKSQGRDVQAREVLSGLVDGDPAPSAEAFLAIVRTFTVLGDPGAAGLFRGQGRARFPADSRFR